jgi:hypothetical protein
MAFFGLFNSTPPQCEKGEPLPNKFKYTIKRDEPGVSNFGAKTQTYCQRHFIEEFITQIKLFHKPVIVSEPLWDKKGAQKDSQWVYYTIPDLSTDNFSSEDQQDITHLLPNATSEKPIIWLPKTVIGTVTDQPLIKQKNIYELITPDTLKEKLQTAFLEYNHFEKGEFHTNPPYDDAGIFVYTYYL